MLFGAVFGNKIGHARAGDRGLEAGGLGDGPFAHVAAIGPAADAEAIGVGNSFGDQVVDAGHDVLIICAAPVAAIAFDEFFAVADGAANIRIENSVAASDEKLSPIVDGRFPCAGWPAMDQSDKR